MIKRRTIIFWIIIFLLFVLITPEGFSYLFNVNDLFKIITIMIMFIFLLLCIINKRWPSFITILLLAFNIWLILVTGMKKSYALSTAALSAVRVVSLCLMFEFYRRDILVFISA